MLSSETNRKSQKLFPFENMTKKMVVYTYTLNYETGMIPDIELKYILNMYSQTSIVRNALDFQLFFELSEFRTYRVVFFRIVEKIRAYKITACSRRMCEITYLFYET